MLRTAGLCLLTIIALVAAVPSAHAAFPGANGKLAFTHLDLPPTEQNSDVFTVNPDGSSPTPVTSSPTHDRGPAWSADGLKIAWECNSALCIANADGSSPTMVPGSQAYGTSQPAWSPDGQKLAFNCDAHAVCSINVDGTDEQQLFCGGCQGGEAGGNAYAPAWSPDGQSIAFTLALRDEFFAFYDWSIWVMDADGANPRQITVGDEGSFPIARDPNWSPNGRGLAFECSPELSSDYGGHICTVNRDGSNFTTFGLELGPGPNIQPAWSPDGRRIAFASGRHIQGGCFSCDYEIYTTNPDGTQTRVTNSPDSETDPDWQPTFPLEAYPRPGSATPLRVPLAPAYAPCTSPNSTHVAPLDLPTCTPPVQESSLLTSYQHGRGSAFLRLSAIVGNPSTPADEADLGISLRATDVVRRSDSSDYTGQVILSLSARITDKRSGFGGVPATVADTQLSWPVDCVANPGVAGGTCSLKTTAEALVPNLFVEHKRAIVATPAIRVLDLGPNGTGVGSGCPPTCGDGDEDTYLEQALFAP